MIVFSLIIIVLILTGVSEPQLLEGYLFNKVSYSDIFLDKVSFNNIINLFSEGNGGNSSNSSNDWPDNFMDLSSSSDGIPKWGTGMCDDSSSVTTPPSKGDGGGAVTTNTSNGSQSSKLPQTEFEKQPYLDNQPLPKSQSDPTSLGKENK